MAATVFPPGLVWLASYPKSGNTWMRVLLANLLTGTAEPADINALGEDELLIGRWRFSDDMLVDADLLEPQELDRLRPLQCDFVAAGLTSPFFCKTHDRFARPDGTPVLGAAARCALYLVRDPRDVAISLAHHLGTGPDHAIALLFDEQARAASPKQLGYRIGEWAGHVSGWTGQTEMPVRVVRYEDLRRDTVAVLRDVLAFLGASTTEEDLARAIDHSRLEALQRQEADKGFRERQPGQKRFFRSGRTGEWRDVMTADQVRSIEQRLGPAMLALGYELTT